MAYNRALSLVGPSPGVLVTKMNQINRAFKVGLLVGIFTIAVALFQQSGNGRYQYVTKGEEGIVVDTRTGEFWTEAGSHFEPREARITTHVPFVIDQAARDRRMNSYLDCVHDGAADCLAQLLPKRQKPPESTASQKAPESGAAKASDIAPQTDDASSKP